MALISLQDVTLGFGGQPLLDQIQLQIEKGERIGVLGRNGVGKSTLLKVIQGELAPDAGSVSRQQNTICAILPQEVPPHLSGSVVEIIRSGLAILPSHPLEAWQQQNRIDETLSRTQVDCTKSFQLLSAGMKRRVLLARGLVSHPDILLLDEPTNHLDIDSIDWLEQFLKRWYGTLVFVTHDRTFLQKISTRIVEIDRGQLFDWKCDYISFQKRKEAELTATETQNMLFDKKLAHEEEWIRRGIEARRTRNEGRVRALKRLRQIREERREQPGKVQMQLQEARRSGQLVLEGEHLSYTVQGRTLLDDFSISIQRGDRIGIIGPNGSGKTTLLQILLGEIQPDRGTVEPGTNLEICYFDQLRQQLDENKSILDNVGEGRDVVTINGKNRPLIAYLEDFLFSRERVHAPISALSGGERNRLLLARLFARPANLMVMDEPTNDLDIDTLEILEDLLMEFTGTLLLVSHDRTFLNNLVTTTLVMEGEGRVGEYVGGYDEWLEQNLLASTREKKSTSVAPPPATGGTPRRLTYREKQTLEAFRQELETLPVRIEQLERDQSELAAAMSDSAFYQQSEEAIHQAFGRMRSLEDEIHIAYQRWEELSEASL